MQGDGKTTAAARKTPYTLLIAENDDGEATGKLAVPETSLTVSFTFDPLNGLVSVPSGVADDNDLQPLTTVQMMNVPRKPHVVVVDDTLHSSFTWSATTKLLTISNLSLSVAKPFVISWKF
jgi:hypothetical protein